MTIESHADEVTVASVPPGLSPRRRTFDVSLLVTAGAAVLVTAYMLFGNADRLTVGVLTIVLMLLLMLLRVPIGIAFLVASSLGLWTLAGNRVLNASLAEVAFNSTSSWSLSIIPLFILMGIAMGKSGLTSSAYVAARNWFGRLPGGLAVATNFAGAGLAAGSGSTIGITYAVGRIAIPEMIRAGYKPTVTTGSVAMVGALGQIIPPSILLVIYAGIAEVSIGQQLVAGIVPGVILAILFACVIVVWAVVDPKLAPRRSQVPWRTKFASLGTVVPVAAIVGVVLGGLFFGIFTATEAGAFGAVAAIVLGTVVLFRNRKKAGVTTVRRFLSESVMETVTATVAVFFLLIGVMLLTRVITLSGLAQALGDFVTDLGLSSVGLLLALLVMYLILGMFMDTLAAMLLTVPIFLGPLQALDVDLIWFGVFVVILAEVGLVTPPLGILSFIVHSIAGSSLKDGGAKVSLVDVFKGVTPFVVIAIVFLVVMIFFPDLATWLPELSRGS
jgi:tripartite ATP-independent transporter DctM subunit